MLFSLLKLRKKTSAVLAGILIALACLWGIAMWQHLSARDLLHLLAGTLLLILGIMLAAFLLVAGKKLGVRLLRGSHRD